METQNKEKENKEKKEEGKIKEKKEIKKTRVKALAKDLPISTKHAVAICNAIRRKKVRIMQLFLADVIKKKKAVPMKGEIPHRSGIGTSGRYPIKAAGNFVKLLNNLIANASVKNLDTENLIIVKAVANQASRPYKPSRIAYGRKRLKRTHIELEAEAEEIKLKEKIKEGKKEAKEAKIEKLKLEEKKEEKPIEKPKVEPEIKKIKEAKND